MQTIVAWRMVSGTAHVLAAARQAVAIGLTVEEVSEVLYRDWMRLEHALANRPGLHTAIISLQTITHALRSDLEPETEALIDELMGHAA
ncbi:hypothetical protein [Streptomyces mesophilus]|uniref:hypothetical protein n=1 Tax=Streptomyces mesophilus TaxID=1775132 RepID=UPI0013EA8F6A|nr:hypothetical protein [Streptomyces mesophilus]